MDDDNDHNYTVEEKDEVVVVALEVVQGAEVEEHNRWQVQLLEEDKAVVVYIHLEVVVVVVVPNYGWGGVVDLVVLVENVFYGMP